MKKSVSAVLGCCTLFVGACDSGPISDAKEAVRRQMKDPASAEFRDVRLCLNDKAVIQGEVNSKNSFGAYAGFEAFFVADHTVVMPSSATPEMLREMMVRCYDPKAVKATDDFLKEAAAAATAAADRAIQGR